MKYYKTEDEKIVQVVKEFLEARDVYVNGLLELCKMAGAENYYTHSDKTFWAFLFKTPPKEGFKKSSIAPDAWIPKKGNINVRKRLEELKAPGVDKINDIINFSVHFKETANGRYLTFYHPGISLETNIVYFMIGERADWDIPSCIVRISDIEAEKIFNQEANHG